MTDPPQRAKVKLIAHCELCDLVVLNPIGKRVSHLCPTLGVYRPAEVRLPALADDAIRKLAIA